MALLTATISPQAPHAGQTTGGECPQGHPKGCSYSPDTPLSVRPRGRLSTLVLPEHQLLRERVAPGREQGQGRQTRSLCFVQ